MTIESISLEWRPIEEIAGIAGHLYLVARESGQEHGVGVAISAGPSAPNPPVSYGFVRVNNGHGAGSSLSQTIDAYADGETSQDRDSLDISQLLMDSNSFPSLYDVWQYMVQFVNQLAVEQFIYDPTAGLPPRGVGLNSNSIIASALSKVGIDIDDVLPETSTLFPGTDTILSGAGGDYLRGWDGNDTFFDAGGGTDIFHGGNGENLVRSDSSDGHDVVFYDGIDSLAINTAQDLLSWEAVQRKGGVEYIDMLVAQVGSLSVFEILTGRICCETHHRCLIMAVAQRLTKATPVRIPILENCTKWVYKTKLKLPRKILI